MITFLSRLKFGCMEKDLFPLAEWFRTSKTRFSCCLKSYSTLDRHIGRQHKITTVPNISYKNNTVYKIQLLPKNANGCWGVSDLHNSLVLWYTSSFLCYSDSPHVGSSSLVRFQSGWLVWSGRYSPAGYLPLLFLFSEGANILFENPYLPLGKSTYATSFCHAKGVLKISR